MLLVKDLVKTKNLSLVKLIRKLFLIQNFRVKRNKVMIKIWIFLMKLVFHLN